jgi:ABC-type hemin transport system substrate-binding protein
VLQEWDSAREKLVKQLKMSGLPVRILLIQDELDNVPSTYRALCRAIRPQHIATDLAALS